MLGIEGPGGYGLLAAIIFSLAFFLWAVRYWNEHYRKLTTNILDPSSKFDVEDPTEEGEEEPSNNDLEEPTA